MQIFKKFFDWFKGDDATTRAERNEKNWRAWLAKYEPPYTKTRPEFLRVYTTDEGVNWYIHKNALEMTRERAQRIEESVKALEYGISKPDLAKALDEIIEGLEAFAFEKVTVKRVKEFYTKNLPAFKDLRFRIDHIKADDILLEIALYFFYIDGENPYSINEITQERKREIALADDELRAFFLRIIETLYRNSTDASGRDLVEQSKEPSKTQKSNKSEGEGKIEKDIIKKL